MDDGATVTGQYEARDEIAHHCPEGIAPGQVIRVRNGDLHGHEVAWDALDEIGRGLLIHPAFRLGDGPVDRARWVRFKMQTIANAYEQFNPTTTIGRPIDAFAITPSGIYPAP